MAETTMDRDSECFRTVIRFDLRGETKSIIDQVRFDAMRKPHISKCQGVYVCARRGDWRMGFGVDAVCAYNDWWARYRMGNPL